MQTIVIREDWRGTRGGEYYYVREGNKLIHISRYAIKRSKVDESSRGSTIEYVIDINRIRGEQI